VFLAYLFGYKNQPKNWLVYVILTIILASSRRRCFVEINRLGMAIAHHLYRTTCHLMEICLKRSILNITFALFSLTLCLSKGATASSPNMSAGYHSLEEQRTALLRIRSEIIQSSAEEITNVGKARAQWIKKVFLRVGKLNYCNLVPTAQLIDSGKKATVIHYLGFTRFLIDARRIGAVDLALVDLYIDKTGHKVTYLSAGSGNGSFCQESGEVISLTQEESKLLVDLISKEQEIKKSRAELENSSADDTLKILQRLHIDSYGDCTLERSWTSNDGSYFRLKSRNGDFGTFKLTSDDKDFFVNPNEDGRITITSNVSEHSIGSSLQIDFADGKVSLSFYGILPLNFHSKSFSCENKSNRSSDF
jgi:hypothetical protein